MLQRPVLIGLVASCVTLGSLQAQVADVANTAPRLPAAQAWRLGPALVQVGHQEDPSGLELSRVNGAVRLADGRLVVANSASSELIFLRPDGRVERRAGRQGEGPGEFTFLAGIGQMPDGQLWAADFRQRVIHLFDPVGRYARTVSLKEFLVPGGLFPAGVLGDGRFVLFSAATPLGGPAAGFDSTDIIVLDPRTGASRTIARVPKTDFGDPLGTKTFGAPLILAVGPTEIWWGFGDRFSVHRLNPEGRRIGGLSRRVEPVPLTGSLWSQYLEARLAAGRQAGQTAAALEQMRQRLEASTRPSHLPLFSEAILDDLGHLWIKDYALAGAIEPSWHVFDRTGTWVTSLRLPTRLRPMQIGADWILGVERDAEGVESVVVYRLMK
jgi:hypothetical protein